jgi:hypothetical protein
MQCDMACEHCDKTFKNNIFTSTHALDDYYLFLSCKIVSIYYFLS